MQKAISILLLSGCIYNIGFIIFHITFWKLFQWNKELKKVSFVNRQVMQIFNICLIVIFLIMALISVFFQNEIIATKLGISVIIMFSAFWFLRALQQIYFFGFRSVFSTVLTIIFFIGSAIYAAPAYFIFKLN